MESNAIKLELFTAETLMARLEERSDWLLTALQDLGTSGTIVDKDGDCLAEACMGWAKELDILFTDMLKENPNLETKELMDKSLAFIDTVMGAEGVVRNTFLDCCEEHIEFLVKKANATLVELYPKLIVPVNG